MDKNQVFKELEKVNPLKAYYLDLRRRGCIQVLGLPYFIGCSMFFIGVPVQVYNFLIGWSMILLGVIFFLISAILIIFTNKRYDKIFYLELLKARKKKHG